MAKKAKGDRVQVILECTEQKGTGVPGISRYITTKNRKNTTERLELKKYNPYLKRMTVHKDSWSKVIKMVRSEKTGAYVFEERMVPNDKVQDWLK